MFSIKGRTIIHSICTKNNYKGEKEKWGITEENNLWGKNRECERYCSEVENSKECYFFWMCSGLWSFTQIYKCKILTIVIFVAPLGSWFFPYLGGFPRKILVSLFLFYSRWLTVLLCSAFVAFITANIISVTDLFPTNRTIRSLKCHERDNDIREESS